MNINKPNSSLLSSLTSLLNAQQREQQGTLSNTKNLEQKEYNAVQTRKITGKANRQDDINANRVALKNLQDHLKADNLEKLKAKFSTEESDTKTKNRDINLNLRENLGESRKPINTRLGQIIDIRV